MKQYFDFAAMLNGRRVQLHWEDGGVLTGDPELAQAVRKLAEQEEGQGLSTGDWWESTHDHLKHPQAVLYLLGILLHGEGEVTGNVPDPPRAIEDYTPEERRRLTAL